MIAYTAGVAHVSAHPDFPSQQVVFAPGLALGLIFLKCTRSRRK